MAAEDSKSQKGPRACATCARAKSRCVPGPEGMKCERCHRLNKSCPSQTPAPPRKRKEPKPGRIGELERRIMDLTARVESVQRQAPSPPDSESLTPSGRRTSEGQIQNHQDPSLSVRVRTVPWPGGAYAHIFPETEDASKPSDAPGIIPFSSTTEPSSPQSSSQPVQWPEGTEAEELLAVYKRHMQHLFPFAVVPPRMSSYELQQTKPFFWKAVMVEAHHNDGTRQMELGAKLLQDISEAAITKPMKSLDLLQGLQVLVSWYHYNLNSFQMTNLLYLARSICASLGFSELHGTNEPKDFSSEYLERMRAFAGTYYLVTVVFTTNKKPDGLMGTTYLEECCSTLETRMEYPTDGLLVWLVRAQQLSQSICLALAFRNAGVLGQEPLASVIGRFEQQIQAYRDRVPLVVKDDPSLLGHIFVAEILLYEIGLQEEAHFVSHAYAFTSTYRLNLLQSCLQATKAFLTNRFAHEMGEWPRFACMTSFDFVYSFLTALKLITLRLPGWDLDVVRRELEFDKFIERQVRDMEYMVDRRRRRRRFIFGNWGGLAETEGMVDGVVAADENENEDPFLKLAKKIRVLSRMMREELNNQYATAQLNMAADTGPMTVTDAEGIMHQLESSIWGEPVIDDWDMMGGVFFSGAFG